MTTKKEVKTFTETKGSGADKEVTVTVETTITKPDGSKTITKEVTTTKGEAAGGSDDKKSHGGFGVDRMSLEDRDDLFRKKDKKDKKHSRRGSRSSSSSSDSSPERKKDKPKDLKGFSDDAVKAHNEKRKLHGVDPLKHSKDLSKFAQKWAEHLASIDSLAHSDCKIDGGEQLGENVSMKYSSAPGFDVSGKEVTEQWYDEINKLSPSDYKLETFPKGTGHFSQVVWKGSKEMGIGKAKSKSGKVYSVGSYRPAGNWVGEYNKNVFPLKK